MIPAPSTSKAPKKKRSSSSGSKTRAKAIREIKAEQKSTDRVIPLAPFQRLVQEIADERAEGMRFRKEAIEALQIEAEEVVTTMFQGANMIAAKCGRETLHADDIIAYNTINNM